MTDYPVKENESIIGSLTTEAPTTDGIIDTETKFTENSNSWTTTTTGSPNMATPSYLPGSDIEKCLAGRFVEGQFIWCEPPNRPDECSIEIWNELQKDGMPSKCEGNIILEFENIICFHEKIEKCLIMIQIKKLFIL